MSGVKCPADLRIEAFLNDYFSDLRLLVAAPPARRDAGPPRATGSPACSRSRMTRTSTATTTSARTACVTACFTTRRATGARRRGYSTSPRAACRSRATSRPSRGRFRRAVPAAVAPPPDLLRALHGQPAEPPVLRLAPAPAGRRPRGSRGLQPGRWRSASSRREAWSATWILSNRFSATRAIPILPENDAALDAEHWTGHTGCVILAPHLTKLTKRELGLPHCRGATERQRRDGMCWRERKEQYNDGQAFKITCRAAPGVIVTIIADNYYGYCKKEVKTQISYAANLFGGAEEEHAGGAIVFPATVSAKNSTQSEHAQQWPDIRGCGPRRRRAGRVKPEGYGVDRIPEPGVHSGGRPRDAPPADLVGPRRPRRCASRSCPARSTWPPRATRCAWRSIPARELANHRDSRPRAFSATNPAP